MVALDRLPTPTDMVAHLDRFVVGQARAKRALATAVYRHFMDRAVHEIDASARGARHHVLLLGPTGSGKSHLVRVLAEYLGVPVAICSATSLSEVGYMGDSVDSLMAALLGAAGGKLDRAHRGIVFLDEVDKLRRSNEHGRDVSGEGVQNALLTLLDGLPVRFRRGEQTIEMDSSRVLFVFAGAFAALPAIVRERRAPRTALGFGATTERRPGDLEDGQAYHEASPDDLIRFGMIPELIGRMSTIAVVEPLGVGDLVRVLRDVECAPLARERGHFERHGLRLEMPEESCHALARKASRAGTGARGLARLLGEVLAPVTWQLPELAAQGVAGIRVHLEAVERGAEPEQLARAEAGAPPEPGVSLDALRRAATSGRALEARVPASVVQFMESLSADPRDSSTTLKRKLGFQHLRGARLQRWLEFERVAPPGDVARLLQRLQASSASLASFADALAAYPAEDTEALAHYAAFLEARKRRVSRRAAKAPRGQDDQPELEF